MCEGEAVTEGGMFQLGLCVRVSADPGQHEGGKARASPRVEKGLCQSRGGEEAFFAVNS